MSAVDILTDETGKEGNFIQHEIKWDEVSNSLRLLEAQSKPKPVIKPTIERVIDRITERIQKSGSIPESFPIETSPLSFQTGSDYLEKSLAETKQRLSYYSTVCEGMA